jgi:hypothetical protein
VPGVLVFLLLESWRLGEDRRKGWPRNTTSRHAGVYWNGEKEEYFSGGRDKEEIIHSKLMTEKGELEHDLIDYVKLLA